MESLKNLFFEIPMNKIADAVHSRKVHSKDDRGNIYFDYLVSSDQNQGRIHQFGDGVPFPRPRKIKPALQQDEELLVISFLEKLSAIFIIEDFLYLIPAAGCKETFFNNPTGIRESIREIMEWKTRLGPSVGKNNIFPRCRVHYSSFEHLVNAHCDWMNPMELLSSLVALFCMYVLATDKESNNEGRLNIRRTGIHSYGCSALER